MNTVVILVVATMALSGIGAGASLDVSIRQLPARHRIGVMAYLFNRFERLQTVRAVLDVVIFGTALWALVSSLS